MTRMLALFGVLLALVGVSPASGKVHDLYALRYGARMNLLLPYDPVRLVPSGRAIRMGYFAHAWSMSPDRSRFVAAAGGPATRGAPASLRFVDLASGRIEGTLTLEGEFRRVTATAWVPGRVLVVVSGSDSTAVYAVDPDTRLVTSHVEFPGAVVVGERTWKKIVLLLATPGLIGPATLAVVDRSPRVRTVLLDRISIGMTATGTGSDRRITVRRPGLTVSPLGSRAFVFGADEPVAEIDLRTLAVRYPPLRTIAAVTKRTKGSVRTAAALPDGRIVVSGFDFGVAGSTILQLVDPRNWSSRALEPVGSWFRVGGGMVFTHGARGTGLRILKPSGSVIELFAGRSVGDVHVVGPRALVTFFGTKQKAAVIELGTGRVVRQTVPAHPLIGAGQSILGW
jgi:hypothetical protein